MKPKSHVLAATAGFIACAATAISPPALSADRHEGGDRGVIRPRAEAIVIFQEPAGSDVDTRGRSSTKLDSYSQWPFVTQAYRRPLQHARPYQRRDQIALTLRFGDAFGFILVEPRAPFEPLAPWVRLVPRYFYGRPQAPRHRPAPVILNEWPHAPWFQDTPRRHHARPYDRRHRDVTRFDRARPQGPRVRHQWRPERIARHDRNRRER